MISKFMKYKYRIITTMSDRGVQLYCAQYSLTWLPLWIDIGAYEDLVLTVELIEREKKKDSFKSEIVYEEGKQ